MNISPCLQSLFLLPVFCTLTGPVCGRLEAWQRNLTLKSNEASIIFRSGPHRSGRGFLLSYASDQLPGRTFLKLLDDYL